MDNVSLGCCCCGCSVICFGVELDGESEDIFMAMDGGLGCLYIYIIHVYIYILVLGFVYVVDYSIM